ncbi:MAG: 3-deoxy-8-phosphooctulonate synthase [Endomicrobium sp.]|jgi:2-dehydro-3-deoxyphosphooctonate aldolase (KDO 8-P synthase)|nr:3-deoxy-8-phosphooctulonate synthase [Endomicrobium sp.]
MKNKIINKQIKINENIILSNDSPIVIIAGPCVIESEKHAMFLAEKLKKITSDLKMPFIFKSSYDKANRSSFDSYRGPGIDEGIKILAKIKNYLNLPIITDVHSEDQVQIVSNNVDFLQIPAFLSRQTDLIKACAFTKKPVNIKKGQFLAPDDMKNVVIKMEKFGNKKIALTERGTSFGYHNLVVDFRSIEIMKSIGYPVIFDVTHSVQIPSGFGTSSSGNREFILPLSKASVAVGISALFLEVHDDPNNALSDGMNSLDIKDFKQLLIYIKTIDSFVKKYKL